MAQIVEVPGVGHVEFPDGMNDAAIVQAIKKMAPTKAPSPADGIGAMEAGLIAAGRSTDKIVQGARQLFNKAIGDQATLDKIAQEQADNDAAYAPLKAAHPTATNIGEALPALAVPVGGAAGGTAAFLARSGVAGALPGLASYGSAEDRLKAGALGAVGGALGGALGLGIGKVLKPSGAAEAIAPEAAQAAERLGMKLSAGQKTQNPAMMNFENYLSRSPGSSGAMQAKAAANQSALNKAAASSMGQAGDVLGEGTFAAAKNAIGAEFSRLGGITNPKLGSEFMDALVKIDSANAARGAFKSKSVDSLVDKGLELAAKGKLDGVAYKEIRTALNNDAQAAFKSGDSTYGQALKTVRNALDDAAKASLSKEDQKAWDVARAQWSAYKTLTKSNVSEAGNVSAARTAAALRSGGDSFRTGAMNGPLADIGRVGEGLKSVQNPNSGQLMNQMMFGNPVTGIPMAAMNKAAESVYSSRPVQSYLSRGLMDIGDNGLLLTGRLGQAASLPMLKNLLGAQ